MASEIAFVPKRLLQEVKDALTAIAQKTPVPRRRTRAKTDDVRSPSLRTRARKQSPIRATHPNHFWSSDFSLLELFRSFHLAAILDLYSRDLLAWALFPSQPEGADVKTLFEEAVRRHGKPAHFVSDRGGQFQDEELEVTLATLGVDHRFGAVGHHGSIAIIERTWRSLKTSLALDTVRPGVAEILRESIAVVIDHYRTKRPHQGIGNTTPAARYLGHPSLAEHAVPAPRGLPGQSCPPPPFVIRFAFAPEQRLPYLQRIA